MLEIQGQEFELGDVCDMIEDLITMLRKRNLTLYEINRINEIEDFSVNFLGDD